MPCQGKGHRVQRRQTDWQARFAQLGRDIADRPVRQIDWERGLWLFGAGRFGQDLARVMQLEGLTPSGFVETNPAKAEVLGLPVCSWKELRERAPDAQIALAIFNRAAPYDVLGKIAAEAGFDLHYMPWDVYRVFGKRLGWRFWLQDPAMLAANMGRLFAVAARLADEESRSTLFRVCAFRAGLDPEFSSFSSSSTQYFNELTLPHITGRRVSYVDCGAYDGDTYEQLCEAGVVCSRAYLLEPDPQNFAKLVRRMRERAETICLPLAASVCQEVLSFDAGGLESSTFSTAGNTKVTAVPLDQLLCAGRLDFLKLDIEGAEAAALTGARHVLGRNRPVVAASLYHNPQDIWALPELIFNLCQDYNYYIRQHYFNSFDLVFYAVPKSAG